jgi:hypothetical protein
MIASRPFPLALIATTLAGLLLAALGPFGTYLNGTFPSRLLYWLATGWLGLALYGAVLLSLRPWLSGSAWRRWSSVAAGSLLASGPEAWFSHWLAMEMWPVLAAHAPSLLLWYGQTALIGGVWTLALARLLVDDGSRRTANVPASAEPPTDAMALFSGDVLALQMEDHYIRVHRPEGSQLVLMPLGQGIAALGSIEGLRTHRSWWVARAAVTEVQGTPRAMKLRLRNGLEAPVARSAVTSLRQAGWIEAR